MALRAPRKKAAKPCLQEMMEAIQGAMRERNLNTRDVCEKLGISIDKRPAVYNWVTGKNGPSETYRAKLAKVLGLTEEQLTSPVVRGRHHQQAKPLGPAQRALVAAQAAQPLSAIVMAPQTEPVRDVFTIAGRSDGQINVRLQTTLDAKRGMALARFLLDFGLIIGDQEDEPGG